MADVFLSYASADRARVELIVRALEEQGFSVWWDRDIRAGSKFDREIEQSLRGASCVVVVWSRASTESEGGREEAHDALRRDILVPLQIEDCELPLGFRRIQTTRLQSDAALPSHLCDSIRRVIGKPLRAPLPADQSHHPVGVSILTSDQESSAVIRLGVINLLAKVGWMAVRTPTYGGSSAFQLYLEVRSGESTTRLLCRLLDCRLDTEILGLSKEYDSQVFLSNAKQISAAAVAAHLSAQG